MFDCWVSGRRRAAVCQHLSLLVEQNWMETLTMFTRLRTQKVQRINIWCNYQTGSSFLLTVRSCGSWDLKVHQC